MWRWKKMNAKRREENIWLVCFQREKHWRGMRSRMEIETWRRTPSYSITSFSQRRKAWPRPSVSAITSVAWWASMAAPLTGGCSSMCPLTPAPDRRSASSNSVLLEEKDHRREGRVARTRFRELAGGSENEGDKENTPKF